jgi:hypothetical protein
MKNPDFYLSSAREYLPLSYPRACYADARLRDSNRDDYMLVRINPPLIGQRFGLGNSDVDRLILSTRHQGYTLFPVTEWPSHVYVSRIVNQSILECNHFQKQDVELIAWALIFRTAKEAADLCR